MTFGQIKTLIEKTLVESYTDTNNFKQTLKEFKIDVLSNKNILKAYHLYDALSSAQGLGENDAFHFVTEGIDTIQKLLQKINLPKRTTKDIKNNYALIDKLIYESDKLSLSEKIETKKELVKIIMEKKPDIKESVNIPVSTMVKVANQSLNKYIESLDESSKNELLEIINEDKEFLELKFDVMKDDATHKLSEIMKKESDSTTKNKITETITRIKNEKFSQINFYKLKKLNESI